MKERKQAVSPKRIDLTEDVIRRMYVDQKKSAFEIAKSLGVTPVLVYRNMRRYGIPRRSLKEAFAVSPTHQKNDPRKGPDDSRWLGRKMFMGYVQVYHPDHPEADARGYVFEHRLVAENQLGRRIQSDEDVHHINGDRADNRPGNLEVMTRAEHMSLHANKKHAEGLKNFGFPRKDNDQ